MTVGTAYTIERTEVNIIDFNLIFPIPFFLVYFTVTGPTSLFHDDGTMRTTSKADLAQQLEQDVSIIQTLPIFDIFRTTLIRDGMPLLRSINAKRFRTFW
jgi:hypothetical protein